MSQYLMPRGTLARLTATNNWKSNVYQLTHDDPKLTTVNIVTLSEHAHTLAIKDAIDRNTSLDQINLVGSHPVVTAILKTNYSHSAEFVKVERNGQITIGVNTVTIDDDAITYALTLLFGIDEIVPGTSRTFGDRIPLHWT